MTRFILCLETATRNCSVALVANGSILALREFAAEGYSHAEKLHVFIEEVLLESSVRYSDLSAVAVSKGPGSYTGLRIGVSAAKGLCYALDIKLISIDTLQVLAGMANISHGLVVPMVDARRMEAYTAIFDAAGHRVRSTEAEILTESSFADIPGPITIVGDCREKAMTVLAGEKFYFPDFPVFPSAAAFSVLADQAFLDQRFEDVAYFEPYYLKSFIATTPKNSAT
jgi:tRNA threonylcarbamoyladenosine biosynthesis protein TsaB